MNEQHNPWTILSSKEVYDNPWLSLTQYDVLNPKGGKGIYGKVHFKNTAIAILPLDDDLNTYLVGQYRFTIDQYSWEIPEGGGPLNTDVLASAKRELKEETGLVARTWIKIQDMYLSNSVTDEKAVVYVAKDLAQEDAMPEETEELVVKKVPFDEAYQMVENGIITDALAVTAILKVKLLLLEGKI